MDLRFVRRRWLLVVGCALAGVVLATVLTVRATPLYESRSRVFVSTGASESGTTATQQATSYASLVTDGDVARRVIAELGLPTSPAELSRRLSAEVVPDTTVLRVSVDDPSAARARTLCRAVVGALLDLISEIETPPGATAPLVDATVVRPATLPREPASPQPLRDVLLGLVVGLLIGVALARLREAVDRSVRSPEDVAAALGTPILGGIGDDLDLTSVPLATGLRPHAPRAEAFRVLRTNLQAVAVERRSRVLVVAGSVPGEGASTIAVSVAIAMARSGRRVLLLDGDLRRPQVAELLDLAGDVGVTTVLHGRIGLDDAIQLHEDSGLSVLTSGSVPPDPAELLESQAMSELLEILREDFDTVVIDAPPLLPVTDAALLARLADGAVVVVRHARTTRDQVAGARARLDAVGARVLGGVANRVRGTVGGYGYWDAYGDDVGAEPEPDRAGTAAAALTPAREPLAARGEVAEVLPIRRTLRSGHRTETSPGPLAETATSDAPRPGKHRS